MQLKNIAPDQHTIVGVLMACAKLGDTETAYQALVFARQCNLKMNEHFYNGMIRTYAGACRVKLNLPEETVDKYIKDTFELLENMEKEGLPINNTVMNSVLILHTNAMR